MAIAQTIVKQINNTDQAILSATQDQCVIGGVISNCISTPTYVYLKRGEDILLSTKVEQGTPFQLACKIMLEQSQILSAYASTSPFDWNNGGISDWNNGDINNWNNQESSEVSATLILTIAEV